MSKNFKQQIFLDELPRYNDGRYKGKIDWKNSIGYNIGFVYDDIEGFVKILDYKSKEQKLIASYNNVKTEIPIATFSRGKLGKLLGIYTSEFKVKIGINIKDEKRDITIIDKEYRYANKKSGYTEKHKWYKFHCNKDGYEGWVEESHLLGKQKGGCSVCTNKKAILGINTIWDTDRWMCDLGLSEEDAKTHTHSSNDYCNPVCPHCKRKKEKKMKICTIYAFHSIGCSCSDSISYPNKFMLKLLMQLQINFENEYNPEWIKPKKYDFYIPSMNLIVEMDGGLGHGKNKHGKSNISKEESKAIDDYKDEQARKHGIKVVRIDCDYKHNNRFEFIKQNIIDSKLNEILNLNKIDWDECELFGLTNLIKIACDYKNNNPELTTTQIGKIMGYHPTTILSWLKQGNGIWCNYDATKEVSRASSRSGKMNGKSVEIFKNGISLGIFPSCCELSRKSLDLFGVKFYEGSISAVCLGKIKQHKGFTFKYI